jgi:hypothetical protein
MEHEGHRHIRRPVAAAARAPSSHNTQPWRFEIANGLVQLWADRRRGLPINDPHDRELTISWAAALFNLDVAARHSGHTVAVTPMPDEGELHLLAEIALSPATEGVHAGYLNQPGQVIELRKALRKSLGTGRFPQLVIRLGRLARLPRPKPRRPLHVAETQSARAEEREDWRPQ